MQTEANQPAKRGRPPKLRHNIEGIPDDVVNAAIEKAVAKRTAEIERKAEKRIKQANKRASEAAGRRVWYGPDKLRAAYLAGQGKTGDEIAKIIGGTTAARVTAMLHEHDIPMLRRGGFYTYMLLKWKIWDRELIEKHAAKRERDPAEMAALIVRKVLAGGDKAIDALVDDLDTIG